MPHPRFTANRYRIHRVIFRPDPSDPSDDPDLVANVTVQVFSEDDTPMDTLPLDLNIPIGQATALKATINARLAQLESETGWTKKPGGPGPSPSPPPL